MPNREKTARSAAAKLRAAAAQVKQTPALIGLDGFVDEIIEVVDKRLDRQTYTPVKTIAHLAQKIAAAAGQSSNYELVVKLRKLGGNGPIMANALACIGLPVTYVGNLGYPALDSVFDEFARRAKVISIAEPGHTDALEFSDGKLMLGKHASLGDVNWQNLIQRVGAEKLKALLSSSQLVGMVNWTMLAHMTDIWSRLLSEMVAGLPKARRTFFVDLADPEKRTHDDIKAALLLLGKFQPHMNVILGLNFKESLEVARVLGLDASEDESIIEARARHIREKLQLGCVVIHPRSAAAAADAHGSARFAGPFVQNPKISTGAGDHFNAGFCLGQVLGLSLEESLACGKATSGYYVRNAESPDTAQLAAFLDALPAPQLS